jgi:hypothetical protein
LGESDVQVNALREQVQELQAAKVCAINVCLLS